MFYGTLIAANEFFAGCLHNYDWSNSSTDEKTRALNEASELIDMFDYINQKVDPLQDLEFPRTGQITVPKEIQRACWLIAQDLIGGRDPAADLENLALKTEVFAGLRAEYNRDRDPQEHLSHMIPNPQAWNLIKPWLRVVKSFSWNSL